jgi:Cu/Ag efflux pump CusA
MDPKVNYEKTVATIQDVVDGYPGLYRDLLTYLRERIKEVLTGSSATLVVRLTVRRKSRYSARQGGGSV